MRGWPCSTEISSANNALGHAQDDSLVGIRGLAEGSLRTAATGVELRIRTVSQPRALARWANTDDRQRRCDSQGRKPSP